MRHLLAALCALTTVLLASCSGSAKAECGATCKQLNDCSFLPSVLGAPAGDNSALDSCVSRCELSDPNGSAYKRIDACALEVRSLGDASGSCVSLGECLHGDFAATPVTGSSDVRIVAGDATCHESGAGSTESSCGPSEGCDHAVASTDAATEASAEVQCDPAGGMRIRAFVESWGHRRYSPARGCTTGPTFVFGDVPAQKQIPIGYQWLDASGQCLKEYQITADVPAGADLSCFAVDLSGSGRDCRDPQDASLEGTAIDALGGDP